MLGDSTAKAAENRKEKLVTDNTPLGGRIPDRNSLRLSAFSASRLSRPRSSVSFRLIQYLPVRKMFVRLIECFSLYSVKQMPRGNR